MVQSTWTYETPGPWRIRRLAQSKGYCIYGGGANKTTVALVPAKHPADAFVVAAAPDLLAAALRVSAVLEARQVEGIEGPLKALNEAITAAMPMIPLQWAKRLPEEE